MATRTGAGLRVAQTAGKSSARRHRGATDTVIDLTKTPIDQRSEKERIRIIGLLQRRQRHRSQSDVGKGHGKGNRGTKRKKQSHGFGSNDERDYEASASDNEYQRGVKRASLRKGEEFTASGLHHCERCAKDRKRKRQKLGPSLLKQREERKLRAYIGPIEQLRSLTFDAIQPRTQPKRSILRKPQISQPGLQTPKVTFRDPIITTSYSPEKDRKREEVPQQLNLPDLPLGECPYCGLTNGLDCQCGRSSPSRKGIHKQNHSTNHQGTGGNDAKASQRDNRPEVNPDPFGDATELGKLDLPELPSDSKTMSETYELDSQHSFASRVDALPCRKVDVSSDSDTNNSASLSNKDCKKCEKNNFDCCWWLDPCCCTTSRTQSPSNLRDDPLENTLAKDLGYSTKEIQAWESLMGCKFVPGMF